MAALLFFFKSPSKYLLTTRNFDGGVIKTAIKVTGRYTGAQRWDVSPKFLPVVLGEAKY